MKVVAPAQGEMNCTAICVGDRRVMHLVACALSEWVTDPVACLFRPRQNQR